MIAAGAAGACATLTHDAFMTPFDGTWSWKRVGRRSDGGKRREREKEKEKRMKKELTVKATYQ